MIYRLCRLPLSVTEYKNEYDRILQIASVNGFEKSLIDKFISKHSNKIKRHDFSTLFSQNILSQKEKFNRIAFTYLPNVTDKLRHCFDRENMKIVYTSANKLRSKLGTTKDQVPLRDRSGIYQISCSHCDAKYIGQTRRALSARIEEHLRSVRKKDVTKAVAAHAYNLDNSHPHNKISFEENVKLLKNVNNPAKLDAYESFYIATTKNLMNIEKENIDSPLFYLVKR